ncbi:MAG: hypothetical protein HDR01_12480 [Lachnospiraceae bacterium]|nr:hypothetical protein [Lachnospiraceae bacterium]
MKRWTNKIRTNIKKYWVLCIIIFVALLPLLLNIGLYITDFIYDKYGFTLTANGLGNQDWLDFWGTYLSVVIAFTGICLAWKSSAEDRKMDKNEKLAQEYDENLKEEKNVLIEVCQSFNTNIVYKTIIELSDMDTKKCKRTLQNARERILDVQVKFELLSDIADGFQKCEGCDFNPCYDRKNMIAVRNLYYKMENVYLQMIQDCSAYVTDMEQQQINEKMMQNENDKILLLQQRICLAKDMATSGSVENIKKMEEEIAGLKYNIEMLKGKRIEDEEMKKLVDSIIEAANLISQEMKPQIISYCKAYIEWKKLHKRELLQEGRIRYIRYPECGKKWIQKTNCAFMLSDIQAGKNQSLSTTQAHIIIEIKNKECHYGESF